MSKKTINSTKLSRTKKERIFIARLIRITAIISFVFSVIFSLLFLFKTPVGINFRNDIDPQIFGLFGDTIGGLIGTILSFLSVYLLFLTYKSQKEELKATQIALDDQKNETTFFNMLATLREIVNTMKGIVRVRDLHGEKIEPRSLKGRDYLHQLSKEIKEEFMYDHLDGDELDYNAATGRLHPFIDTATGHYTEEGMKIERAYQQDWSIKIEDTVEEVVQGIEHRFSVHQGNLSHYFRFVFSTIDFIESLKYTPYKVRYYKTLIAQLSNAEMMVLFYQVLQADRKYKGIFESYHVLEDLDHKSLADTWHHWLYPQTDFKSLHNIELEKKRDYRKRYLISANA